MNIVPQGVEKIDPRLRLHTYIWCITTLACPECILGTRSGTTGEACLWGTWEWGISSMEGTVTKGSAYHTDTDSPASAVGVYDSSMWYSFGEGLK